MSNNQETDFTGLCSFVKDNMTDWGIPGISIGVYYKGITRSAGFGVTNVDHPQPVSEKTLFQIGSITKTFTGTAVMRLIEMGKLALDATVRTYLPDFKVDDETTASQVTIRHLLTHSCGWVGDFFHDTGNGDDALAKYVADMDSLEQLIPLNRTFSYNNSAFSVLGRLIEVTTGTTYEMALQELVLEPMGLTNSFFNPGEVITKCFSVGHLASDNGPRIAHPWSIERSGNPQGGIICDIEDLLQYARFHIGDGRASDGTRLLTQESLSYMQTPQVPISGYDSWGLSWHVNSIDGERQIRHSGDTTGQAALLVIIPERDFAFAVMTNGDMGEYFAEVISDLALKKYLGLEASDPEPIDVEERVLEEYTGLYSRPYMDVELVMEGGKLVSRIKFKQDHLTGDGEPLSSPPSMTLSLIMKDSLFVADGVFKGARVDIIRRTDGSIGWLRAAKRIHVRQNKGTR